MYLKKLSEIVSKIWGNKIFLLLFIFNLLSNLLIIYNYLSFELYPITTTLAVSSLIVCISALSATVESCICRIFKNRTTRNIILYFFIGLHLAVAIVDFFLIYNFQLIFNSNIINIIFQTNPNEAESFFGTYLDFTSLLCYIIGSCLTVCLAIWLSRKLSSHKLVAFISMILTVLGISIFLFLTTVGKGKTSLTVSGLHSFARYGESVIAYKNITREIQLLRDTNRNKINVHLKQENCPTIVLVLGESFSVYHSSLYGYPKLTNPRLSKLATDGSLVVYDDAVSQYDWTQSTMNSIFRISGSEEPNSNKILFPTIFKSAGYTTSLFDNEYFIGEGISWLTDQELSEILYDNRNKESVGYDINLLSLIKESTKPQLLILHLIGQHYAYQYRYPQEFKQFTESDYSSNISKEERELVAHYDNATLYNDFVVDSIIKKFEDENSIVIYFSDHGEDLCETDYYVGHGNAKRRPTALYQIRVPFMIWTSQKFNALYPETVQKIKDAEHKPIITSDLPHLLFDLAGIDTQYFCPQFSFINEQYQISKKRIVLGSLDYDELKNKPLPKSRY